MLERVLAMADFLGLALLEIPTSWGREVDWQLRKYLVRLVYLYLTDKEWILAVGKGDREMPTSLKISCELYALRVCLKSSYVGHQRDCISTHDELGRSVGWY